MHARVFVPPIFIAQDPQIPSRQDRRKVKVGSISFFILIKASKTMGPHLIKYNRFIKISISDIYYFNLPRLGNFSLFNIIFF